MNNLKDKYIIKVTRTDIRKGIKESIHMCPIARAVRRITRAKRVSVLGSSISINGITFIGPDKAYKFVENFDIYGTAKPCQLVFKKERK